MGTARWIAIHFPRIGLTLTPVANITRVAGAKRLWLRSITSRVGTALGRANSRCWGITRFVVVASGKTEGEQQLYTQKTRNDSYRPHNISPLQGCVGIPEIYAEPNIGLSVRNPAAYCQNPEKVNDIRHVT